MKSSKRGKAVAAGALLFCAVVTSGISSASAQDFPSRTVRIVATEAGGSIDTQARMIAQGITGSLGQPVIVENRPSSVLPEVVSKVPADGYTVAFAGGVVWLTPLTEKTSYDPIKDFAPITWVAKYPYLLVVHPSMTVKTPTDLIALAKAHPGELNIAAVASPGAQTFLAAELFKSMAGVNIVRVSYKGTPSALLGLVSGEANVMISDINTLIPQIKAGKVRALAVTSLEPSPLVPGMPTLTSTGLPGYEVVSIVGLLAPGKTPVPIINRLNQEVVQFLNKPDTKEKFLKAGAEVVASTPAQFSDKIKSEMTKWGKVLADAGVKPEL